MEGGGHVQAVNHLNLRLFCEPKHVHAWTIADLEHTLRLVFEGHLSKGIEHVLTDVVVAHPGLKLISFDVVVRRDFVVIRSTAHDDASLRI